MYLIFILLFIFFSAACSAENKSNGDEEQSRTSSETEEIEESTYPLVIENVYLASDGLIDDEVVVLLIEVTNISDDAIEVGTTNFRLEKRDKSVEFIKYGVGVEEITLQPNETNVLFNYQIAPDGIHIDERDLKDFRVTYTGIHYNNHKAMRIKREIPEKYEQLVDEEISRYQGKTVQYEDEYLYEEDEITFDPIKITGYELDTDGTMYVRVENLTDEEFRFDIRYLTIYDAKYEYEKDPKVFDSAFAGMVSIPPNDKLEFRQFFLLSNPEYMDKDEIVRNIIGIRYKTEWPMASKYDIFGKIEDKRPDDFYDG